VTSIGPGGTWSDFATRHWVIGGIMTSLLWFLVGRRSAPDKHGDATVVWQCVGVLIMIVLCVRAAVKGEWLGFACGSAILYLEVQSIRRLLAARDRQNWS
jgi:hypothetical protein